jgi:hypothetical protein
MSIRILIAIVILLPFQVKSQTEPIERQDGPDSVDGDAGAPDVVPGTPSRLDSLYRRLALLEIAKARSLVASSDFWHRLIPRASLEGSIGVRDLAFPEAGGTVILPKDSYRLTFGLSLQSLFDGSEETRAELHLAEAETRFSILMRRQHMMRVAFERKKDELSAELTALRDELFVRKSAVAYQELLFAQGRADFHAVAAARIELIRLKNAATRLEIRVRELEKTSGGEPPE